MKAGLWHFRLLLMSVAIRQKAISSQLEDNQLGEVLEAIAQENKALHPHTV
jgi:hypothetical protein